MNPKIILGSIVYNEEHRFLEKYLSNIRSRTGQMSKNMIKDYENKIKA